MNTQKKRIILIAFMLILAFANYYRIEGNETIRTIQFLSIFVIGALSSLLVREIVLALKSR